MKHSNLIGISGTLNSGKDFTAKIIQYFVAKSDGTIPKNISVYDFVNWSDQQRYKLSTFETKQFAGKLKQMTALFLGVPIHALEDRNFKEKLIPEFDFKSPRFILQTLGTQWGRDIMGEDTWANALLKEYFPLSVTNGLFKEVPPLEVRPNWLITDTRFPNEADRIQASKGFVIRVDRPLAYRFPKEYAAFLAHDSFKTFEEYLESIQVLEKIKHASETGLDEYTNFKHRVHWTDEPEELIADIEAILKDERII